jgi:hypothetical protein
MQNELWALAAMIAREYVGKHPGGGRSRRVVTVDKFGMDVLGKGSRHSIYVANEGDMLPLGSR